MILRLDPGIPRVWRDPQTLQFGVDRPTAVLHFVTLEEERLIHAVAAGISRAALDHLAGHCGVGPTQLDDLLDRLAPALLATAPLSAPRVVGIAGGGLTVDIVERTLSSLGVAVHRVGATSLAAASPGHRDDVDFGIAIGAHVLDPRLHRHWLRRDIPHLAVIVGDVGVRVGPIVEPGVGACLHCVDRHAIDADPAWTAIAAQLLDRPIREHPPVVALEAAARVVRSVTAYLDRGAPLPHIESIDTATGAVVVRPVAPHPECGCRVPQGNDSVGARQSDSAHAPPTRATANGGLE